MRHFCNTIRANPFEKETIISVSSDNIQLLAFFNVALEFVIGKRETRTHINNNYEISQRKNVQIDTVKKKKTINESL